MSEQIGRDIEAILEGRVERGCVLCHPVDLPFTAFQMLLSPDDRILMSPLEDDAAFFGVLTVSSGPSWRNASVFVITSYHAA